MIFDVRVKGPPHDCRLDAYAVVVDGKRPGQLWGKYATREAAEEAARKLRVLGMPARVGAPRDELALKQETQP